MCSGRERHEAVEKFKTVICPRNKLEKRNWPYAQEILLKVDMHVLHIVSRICSSILRNLSSISSSLQTCRLRMVTCATWKFIRVSKELIKSSVVYFDQRWASRDCGLQKNQLRSGKIFCLYFSIFNLRSKNLTRKTIGITGLG